MAIPGLQVSGLQISGLQIPGLQIPCRSLACISLAWCLAGCASRWQVLPAGQTEQPSSREEQCMLDVMLLAAGVGFFALSIAYAFGCDRL
jgi:hypothetical protein